MHEFSESFSESRRDDEIKLSLPVAKGGFHGIRQGEMRKYPIGFSLLSIVCFLMHTLQRTGLFGIILFENSFKILDAHLSLSLSLSLSHLVNSAIFPTDGACEYPLDLRGDWYTTSNGVVTFSNQSISNFKSLTHPSAHTYTCEYIDNDRYITR